MADRSERAQNSDWSIAFDLIASEYGYTWEQFVRMTYKQLFAWLEAIARRTHNRMAFEANIHGFKADLYKKSVPLKISEETLKIAEDETLKMLKEKQRAAKNGKR